MSDEKEVTIWDLVIVATISIIAVFLVWLIMEHRYNECMEQKHDEIFCKLYMRN